MSVWHQLSAEQVVQQLGGDAHHGLTTSEAARRLAETGPNQLIDHGVKSPWRILGEQLTALMVVILLAAAAVSAAIGDWKDAVAILGIVVLNAVLGFVQEFRAERALAALKKLAAPVVKVRRDGVVREMSASQLVPGDLVLLEAGGAVPADCRLLEAVNLRLQEAALTGESEPVDKDAVLSAAPDAPVGDRRNMAYLGTAVSAGRGSGVVVATGMSTELGRIAKLIQGVGREATPLQRRLTGLGRGLAVVVLVLALAVLGLGLARGEPLTLMLMTAVSVAVAAVPEALPAVVTITLALGAQRMLQRRALIRKLPAVETLGSVTVICSDKTGTLTQNRMTVTCLEASGQRIGLHGPPGSSDLVGRNSQAYTPPPDTALLLAGLTLCNDAELSPTGDGLPLGDPTETALLVAAARWGLFRKELECQLPRIAEVPFDSERKRMTTIHRLTPVARPTEDLAARPDWERIGGGSAGLAFTKGAVDGLLQRSAALWRGGRPEPLTPALRQQVAASAEEMAASGVRVLGLAFRQLPTLPANASADLEQELTFVGLVGMMDPPRTEVKDAVATCVAAGIRPLMITGDHPLTARAVAAQLGIDVRGEMVTGQQLAALSAEELKTRTAEVAVYARVSPEHKLRIVQSLQDQGHVVAMTGDGVNDAPALKKADIGVAMGVTGTDVAKEAADIVLLDDNFATIVAAVEEGRVIFDNIRKYIKHTLTGNSGALWVMLLAPLAGLPLPLLPLQLLWVNLVCDGLPSVALGLEPAERRTMRRRPYHPAESIFSRGVGRHIAWVGLLLGLLLLAVGYYGWTTGHPAWQTLVLVALVFARLAHVLGIRSGQDSLFHAGLFSNRTLLGAVLLTVLLQMALVYLPPLQRVFQTGPLGLVDVALCLAVAAVVFAAVELEKLLQRRADTRVTGREA